MFSWSSYIFLDLCLNLKNIAIIEKYFVHPSLMTAKMSVVNPSKNPATSKKSKTRKAGGGFCSALLPTPGQAAAAMAGSKKSEAQLHTGTMPPRPRNPARNEAQLGNLHTPTFEI